MEPFQRLLAQLRTFWGGLGTLRKIALVSVTVLVFVALIAFSYLSTATAEYKPLFPVALRLEEVQPITTKLNTLAIPYKLANEGTVVTVPVDRASEARVALAADGIPTRTGKGYEIFDESSFGSTPFVQNVNLQRALQSELAKSIMQLEPVELARVLIAKPEPTPFVREQRPPTASVVLKLKPGANLSRDTAGSIVSLVARSVDGLKPENVTVVDSSGRLLSDPHAHERDDLPTAQIQYRRQVEEHLANKAEEMLTRTLGGGRAVVRVSVDINFQKLRERQEMFTPDGKVVVAERNSNSQTTSPQRGGVTGARSNIAPAGGSSSGGAGSSKEEVNNADYWIPRTVRELEADRAPVQRLNVAALVDLTPPEGGGPAMTIADAEDLIRKAVGFTTGRDEIKVSNVRLGSPTPPLTPEGEDEAAKLAKLQAYVAIGRNISLAVAVVLAVALIPLIMIRRRPRPLPAPPPPPPPEVTPEQRRQEMIDKLKDLARTDPDRVAEVMTILAGAKA